MNKFFFILMALALVFTSVLCPGKKHTEEGATEESTTEEGTTQEGSTQEGSAQEGAQ